MTDEEKMLEQFKKDAETQPEYGSERYKEQVETIFAVCSQAENRARADEAALMYILDGTYHRAAISEALKMLDKHYGTKQDS